MPASMHQVLMHGADVKNMLLLPLPSGIYSEEAQEAQKKYNRQYRLKHARKNSRLHTITDQLKYLLVTSDPLITNIIAKDLHRRRCRQSSASASADPTRQTDITPLLRDGAATTDDSPSGEDGKPAVWVN